MQGKKDFEQKPTAREEGCYPGWKHELGRTDQTASEDCDWPRPKKCLRMREKERTVQTASEDGDWPRPKKCLRMREKIEQIGWDWPKMRQKCGNGWD